jgi:hypothetical protein
VAVSGRHPSAASSRTTRVMIGSAAGAASIAASLAATSHVMPGPALVLAHTPRRSTVRSLYSVGSAVLESSLAASVILT